MEYYLIKEKDPFVNPPGVKCWLYESSNYNLSSVEVETLIEGAAASPHTTLHNVVRRFAPWYSSQIGNPQA